MQKINKELSQKCQKDDSKTATVITSFCRFFTPDALFTNKICTFTFMEESKEFIQDEIYAERLLISVNADHRESRSNIRAARAILHSFADVSIIINAHTMSFVHKNPEHTIDGQLGDRKGIMGEKGGDCRLQSRQETRLQDSGDRP